MLCDCIMTRKQAYKTKYQGPHYFNYVTADRMYTLFAALNFVLAYNNGFIRKGCHKTISRLQDLIIQNYANNRLHTRFLPSSEIFMF